MSDRVPLKTGTPGITAEESRPQKDITATGSLSHMDNIEYQQFADLFELGYEDRKDTNVFDKLTHLYEFGKNKVGENDKIKIYTALKEVTRGMGWVDKGKSQIEKLYKWSRLDQTRRKAEEAMEAMYA